MWRAACIRAWTLCDSGVLRAAFRRKSVTSLVLGLGQCCGGTEMLEPIPFAVIFFLVALLYSSVGLGGGSSYTAILAIAGIAPAIIPTTSLTLNVIVAGLGLVNFSRAGYFRSKLILPLLLASMPMAYLGGRLALPERVFHWLLLGTLEADVVGGIDVLKLMVHEVVSETEEHGRKPEEITIVRRERNPSGES